MQSLMSIYRRVYSFYPETCFPISEMLMPNSYQRQRSHLWLLPAVEYRKHQGEESVCNCCVLLLLDWTSPCLVSPCDPISVFLVCFLITWLFMGNLKQNLLPSPNLDSSLLFLSRLSLPSVSFQQLRLVQVIPDVRVQMCKKLYHWKDSCL